jgi:hypothetical protein
MGKSGLLNPKKVEMKKIKKDIYILIAMCLISTMAFSSSFIRLDSLALAKAKTTFLMHYGSSPTLGCPLAFSIYSTLLLKIQHKSYNILLIKI